MCAPSVDENTGVEDALGIERLLVGAQRHAERVRALTVVARSVIPTDGVVVCDRRTMAAEHLARSRLDVVPHGEFRTTAPRCDDGEVRRGAVRVDVREPAVDHTSPAGDALDRGADVRAYRLVQLERSVP